MPTSPDEFISGNSTAYFRLLFASRQRYCEDVSSWLQWLVIAAAIYALAVLGASRMLYFPFRYPQGNWAVRQSLGAEDVWIRHRLHGWAIRRPGSRLMSLHLHGNGGNITHRSLAARHIADAGSSVLLLDYRGYGRSEGRPTERGLYEDAEAAYRWILAQGFEPQQIIVHGESLGTAVAVDLASRLPCAGVVLEAPFTSARAMAWRVLPVLGPALVWGYDSLSKIGRVRVPIFVIHGDEDEVIAYEFGRELFRAAPEPKSFWTIQGATHNDLHIAGGVEFVARLKSFYLSLPQHVVDDAK
jgi:pimeloyl-ACP methyl ester carboxylesterase